MHQRQLASVLFAVVGMLVAASRLPEIMIYVAMLAQGNSAPANHTETVAQRLLPLMGLCSSLLAVLLGSGLVLLRDRLADRLFPLGSGPLNAREVQAVAFSVLGCYFAVEGISHVLWAGRLDWRRLHSSRWGSPSSSAPVAFRDFGRSPVPLATTRRNEGEVAGCLAAGT